MSEPTYRANASLLTEPRRRAPNIVWLCLIMSALAAIAVFLMFGPSFWTLLVIALMVACPAIVIGVLMIEWKTASRDFRSMK